MNQYIIVDARVVSDEAKTRQAGKQTITKIRVADNTPVRNERNPGRFVNVEIWGKQGEALTRLSKGDIISVYGELVIDKFTTKEGVEKFDDLLKAQGFRVQKSTSFFEGGKKEPEPEDAADLPF